MTGTLAGEHCHVTGTPPRQLPDPACTPIVLDNANPLYSYLNGQGAVRAYVQGTDDVSHAAISN